MNKVNKKYRLTKTNKKVIVVLEKLKWDNDIFVPNNI